MALRVRSIALLCALGVLAGASVASVDAASITLVARYPVQQLGGKGLYVRGDGLGLNWKAGVEMTQSSTDADSWSIQLSGSTSDAAGVFSFKALVGDADWQIGANEMVALGGASGDATVAFYPFFYSNAGRYQVVPGIYSPQLDDTRDLVVYVPPSFDENPYKQYRNPILMHDGENLFNASTSFGGIAWKCDQTIDALVAEGSMEEVLIIGVYNDVNRTAEYTYSRDPTYGGGDAKPYLDFLEETVLPLAAKSFRVPLPTQQRWGMIGSSLAGLLSCYAGWTRSETYDKVGCMSSSFWWDSQDFNNVVLEAPPAGGPPKVKFYLDSGDSGPGKDDKTETLAVRAHLENYGYAVNSTLFYFLDEGGEHNEYYWGRRFWRPMTDLYPPVARPPQATL